MYKYQDRNKIENGQNNLNEFNPSNYFKTASRNYANNPHNQVSIVQSNYLIEQNNSSSVFGLVTNTNRQSSIQIQSQCQTECNNYDINKQDTSKSIINQKQIKKYENHNVMLKSRSNRINVVSQNHSQISNGSNKLINNNQSSLNKRSGSASRGGIRVTSRNQSFQKRSNNSIQKLNNQSLPTGNPSQSSNHNNFRGLNGTNPFCGLGLNCTTRNPFNQNQSTSQAVIIPNLGSLQSLKSQYISNQMLSDRGFNLKERSPYYDQDNNNKRNIYDNFTKNTDIQLSNNINSAKSGNIMLTQKQNVKDLQKVYKNVREMMEKQIQIARKLYQKKYEDQIQTLNILYKSQIDTLQKVLGENQTIIQTQAKKIERLQQKTIKKQMKIEKYQERLQSIKNYIQSSNKYSIERILEVQIKFNILMKEFENLNFGYDKQKSFSNRIQYVKDLFISMISQTITKYRSIQIGIKQQIKQMMKKYEYFQEKIYQMDLQKHLGKQNQIQNIRMNEKIQSIKEKIMLFESNSKGVMNSPRTLKMQYEFSNQTNQTKILLQKMKFVISKCEQDKQILQNKIYQLRMPLFSQKQTTQKKQNFSNFNQQIQKLQKQNNFKNNQIFKLHQLIDQYQIKIQQLHLSISNLQKDKQSLIFKLKTTNENEEKIKQLQNESTIKINNLLSQKDIQVQQTLQRLQNQLKTRQQLEQTLEMTQKIFDQQITKFKQIIKKLQQQNDFLLLQIEQLKEEKTFLSNSSTSKTSQNGKNRLMLSKSPKKQVCQTVTMGWFKKNVVQKNENTMRQTCKSPTQKHKSPIRKIIYSGSQSGSLSPQNDEENYIQKKRNCQSPVHSTSIMQSHPNIIVREDSKNTSVNDNLKQIKQNLRLVAQKQKDKQQRKMKIQMKLRNLKKILQQNNNIFPVECTLDREGQLQIYHTAEYLVDEEYNTFVLSQREQHWAMVNGLITIVKDLEGENYIN